MSDCECSSCISEYCRVWQPFMYIMCVCVCLQMYGFARLYGCLCRTSYVEESVCMYRRVPLHVCKCSVHSTCTYVEELKMFVSYCPMCAIVMSHGVDILILIHADILLTKLITKRSMCIFCHTSYSCTARSFKRSGNKTTFASTRFSLY